MLRLPAIRDALRIASGPIIDELLEAYHVAVFTEDRVRRDSGAPTEWLEEYALLFGELETLITRYLGECEGRDGGL